MNQITEVRKCLNRPSQGLSVVVVIKDGSFGNGYVQPDGTAGKLYEYSSWKEAGAAEELYLIRQGIEPETSAVEKQEINPKDVLGVRRTPVSTLSGQVLFEMGLGMLEGARKYGRHNYRAIGVSATIYYDAAMGHLMDWWEGENIDPDSGLSHITKAMTALAVLRDSMLMGNWKDDRPIRNPHKLNKKSFNVKAEEIIDKYPNCAEPFLENQKGDQDVEKPD